MNSRTGILPVFGVWTLPKTRRTKTLLRDGVQILVALGHPDR